MTYKIYVDGRVHYSSLEPLDRAKLHSYFDTYDFESGDVSPAHLSWYFKTRQPKAVDHNGEKEPGYGHGV